MKKIIVFCFLLASFAFAQQLRVAVLPTVASEATKITPFQKGLLEEEIRAVVNKHLPVSEFVLVSQEQMSEMLGGDSAAFAACGEGSCLGPLVDKVKAQFGARCEVSIDGSQLYLKFALYGTKKGQSIRGDIDFFREKVKDFSEMQALIRSKAPSIFAQIIKLPEQIDCENMPGSKWVNNECKSKEQLACESKGNSWGNGECRTALTIAKEACQAQGDNWINGECKSQAQIVCENRKGYKWVGDDCKTQEQIVCESKGNVWVGGVCRSQVATPAAPVPATPAPAPSVSYTARIVTEPAGASLYLNGMPHQNCPKTPCTISVYDNLLRLKVDLNKYETTDTAVTITMPNELITIKLSPKRYRVGFASAPSGAFLFAEDDQGTQQCHTPCDMFFRKGKVKVSSGFDKYYENKDTTIFVKEEDGQFVTLGLDPKYGTLDIKGASSEWNLQIRGESSSLNNIRLLPGTYKARLINNDYEPIDFSVDIKKNEHKVFDISDKLVHRYGFLDIKSASYLDGIGKDEEWILTLDGEFSSLSERRLLHGEHRLRLTHNCYEDITAEVKVGRNEKTDFDISDKLVLKQGTLVLRSKRKVRNLSKPVFVNGKQVGETPFEGSVPLCSEIKIGKEGKQETVYVKLEHNKPVEYIQRESTWGSHVLGAVLDAAGAGLIGLSFYYFNQSDKLHDNEYSDLRPPYDGSKPSEYRSEYDAAWKKVEDAHSKGNTFLIIGGAVLAVGIGVHIWF